MASNLCGNCGFRLGWSVTEEYVIESNLFLWIKDFCVLLCKNKLKFSSVFRTISEFSETPRGSEFSVQGVVVTKTLHNYKRKHLVSDLSSKLPENKQSICNRQHAQNTDAMRS